MRVIIFGTGQFGHALTGLAMRNHHEVISWSFRENKPITLLPDGDIYVSTLNASGLESVAGDIVSKAAGRPIVSTTKAFIHADSIKDILPSRLLGKSALVFSGPNLASEMLLGLPAGATIAGDHDTFDLVRSVFETSNFSLEYFGDKKIVELMGIMKNIIAIGIGMIDGFALGENAKGIFIARMCHDIAIFARDTFDETFDITSLYAGIGDLFTTCSSTESRNHGFGLYFARTGSIHTAKEFMNTSIEGLWSIEVLRPFLSGRYRVFSGFLDYFSQDGGQVSREVFAQDLLR